MIAISVGRVVTPLRGRVCREWVGKGLEYQAVVRWVAGSGVQQRVDGGSIRRNGDFG